MQYIDASGKIRDPGVLLGPNFLAAYPTGKYLNPGTGVDSMEKK